MAAALLFVLGIKRLSGVKTAKSGARLAAVGMFVAVAATLVFLWGEGGLFLIALGVGIGAVVGAVLALRVPMTSMPEMVALLNGFGGAASLCVALAEVSRFGGLEGLETAQRVDAQGPITLLTGYATKHGAAGGFDYAFAIVLSILIGAVTFSGSLVAFAKLSGKLNKSRLVGLGSQKVNLLLSVVTLAVLVWAGFVAAGAGGMMTANLALAALALVLGIGLVVGIGGADMPVVISLLNSYSGIAAAMTGFVLKNNLLIVAGSLVGASGIILTRIMCKAMNRSLVNVLAGGFGEAAPSAGKGQDEGYTKVKSTTPEEIAPLLDAAQYVIFVPGYGLAVAQAQHKTRELADLLMKKGCKVEYAIHPVAGRMPGHMNVLLAEADVPYEQLKELESINDDFKNADVAIVLGANDVCNPAANDDPASPIAGMPVLHVWDARTVIVVKRSLSSGYAGIKNELFQMDNSLMLFADAKKALEETITELKQL
ncbi:MAG TPA: NAD(P)(+) transhydrogenase (Re/Si-specific) subunit beta [Planctomycetota bacterium]|nr:NAD(P)(+) transhydrogenase (Re/Si-specific) subunit beta [Planctomycetota bacterium]